VAASKRKIRTALRDQRIFYFDCIKHFSHSGKYSFIALSPPRPSFEKEGSPSCKNKLILNACLGRHI
ncbi:hypothetical protein L873DRAFT_1665175, partial [Choiromyces venosus 120613-1]